MIDLQTAIRSTGSVRSFRPDPVDDATVAAVLEDARFAPSGGNKQPWRVAVVKDSAIRQAMAEDGLFFRSAARLNGRGVPAAALVIQALWSAILALSGTYGQLLDFVIFAEVLFFVLTVAAVFVLRRRDPQRPRPYHTWGYPVTPALYIAGCSAILLGLLVYRPSYTWPGLALVLLGLPVYQWIARPEP